MLWKEALSVDISGILSASKGMNEITRIKDAFSFLLKKGFYLEVCEKNNLEYSVVYGSPFLKVLLSYDLRTHQFDVGINIVNSADNPHSYIPLLEINFENELERRKLSDSIKKLYTESQNDWTFSKKHFTSTLDMYAGYLESHLKCLTELCRRCK